MAAARATLELTLRDDAPAQTSTLRPDSMGGFVLRAAGEWKLGAAHAGQHEAVTEPVTVSSHTRRHLIAQRTTAAATYQPGQGTFAWTGGEPATPIDLQDYPEGVAAASQLAVHTNNGLLVLTDRLVPPSQDLTKGFLLLEGEEEAEFRRWDP